MADSLSRKVRPKEVDTCAAISIVVPEWVQEVINSYEMALKVK